MTSLRVTKVKVREKEKEEAGVAALTKLCSEFELKIYWPTIPRINQKIV